MAHHKSAIKRIRTNRRLKLYNRVNRKSLREAVKAVRASTTYDTARTALNEAFSVLDRIAARGILHKNAVAHRKSALSHFVKALEKKA
ncbi:MAG: 30S ribosomal protein S20 [bacterium]|nr:30S ribosomal protein S20 [bacterium]